MSYVKINHHWRFRLGFWFWQRFERYWLLNGIYMILEYKEGDFLPWWSPSRLMRGNNW